jgi:hypothetical protein
MWTTTVNYQLPEGETFLHRREIIQSIADKASELGQENHDGLPYGVNSPTLIDPNSNSGIAKRVWLNESTATEFAQYVSSVCNFATVTVEPK